MPGRSIEGARLDRRSFLGGIAATGALGIMAGAGLAGCSTPKSEAAEPSAPIPTPSETTDWVDAVSSASLSTNKYTNQDKAQLQAAVMAYQAECTVATTNEDGTPNIAIFVPAMIEETYLAFTWAENQTKANFERAKLGMIALDTPNPTAETKEQRHQGALVKASLVEDEDVLARLKALDPMFEVSTFVEIDEILPVG